MRSISLGGVEGFLFDTLLLHASTQVIIKKTLRMTQGTMIANLIAMDFPFFIALVGHVGWWSSSTPPQSLLLPINKIALIFLKTPWTGISPIRLLKERFKYKRYCKLCKSFGTSPHRLFCERSKNWRPFKEALDEGMTTWKVFPCIRRYFKLKQDPMVQEFLRKENCLKHLVYWHLLAFPHLQASRQLVNFVISSSIDIKKEDGKPTWI